MENQVAEKKAKNATDKTKLIELKKRIDEFVLPEMNSDDGRHIVENVHGTLSTISYFLQTKISKL